MKSAAGVLSTTQKLQQNCAVLVCIVVLWQSTWRTKMQYPVALFQKRSQIQSFRTKYLFMISAGCLFPSLIYPWTIWRKNRLKKELHGLSSLLRTKLRTAVLKAGYRGNFPLSCIFPQHAPKPTTTCGSSAWPQNFVVSCTVFFSWLLSHLDFPNCPRNTAGCEGEKMEPQGHHSSKPLSSRITLHCSACMQHWEDKHIYFFFNAGKVWFPKQFLVWNFALLYWLTYVLKSI